MKVSLDKNVEIQIIPQSAKKTPKPELIKLVVPYCDSQGCLTVFGLKSSHIEALNAGAFFNVRLWKRDILTYKRDILGRKSYIPMSASVSGAGFKDAIQGSMMATDNGN